MIQAIKGNEMQGDLLDKLIDDELTTHQIITKNLIMSKGKPIWVFNGHQVTVNETADMIWQHDCPDKTMFLLKYL